MAKRKTLLAAALAFVALAGAATAVSAIVPDPVAVWAAPVPATVEEYGRTVDAMRPPKRARPLVAVLGDNRGTEAIDFMIPYAVLRRANIADVVAVGMTSGPLKLRPALTIEAGATADDFDRRYPAGADYVIVPAMFDHDDARVIRWIRSQADRGATIVAICAGAEILAEGGLLKDRAATTHWASVRKMLEAEPDVRWVPHRRYVADRGIVTTTGVSAAIPASLALVEAIAGAKRARAVATELGISGWDQAHDSRAFGLKGSFPTLFGNSAARWAHEDVALPVSAGVDDVALALTADSWSRTFRSRALTLANAPRVRTRAGLELIVDRNTRRGVDRILAPVDEERPGQALDRSLAAIASTYGEKTARLVALQLEYDGKL